MLSKKIICIFAMAAIAAAGIVIADHSAETILADPPTHTVTYDVGGAPIDTPVQDPVAEGKTFRLPNIKNNCYPGHLFVAWSDGTNLYKSRANVTMGDSDMVFTILWTDAADTFYALTNGSPRVELTAGQEHQAQITMKASKYDYFRLSIGYMDDKGIFEPVKKDGEYVSNEILADFIAFEPLTISGYAIQYDSDTVYNMSIAAGLSSFQADSDWDWIKITEWSSSTNIGGRTLYIHLVSIVGSTFTVGNLDYQVTSDLPCTAEIIGYTGKIKYLAVPESVTGPDNMEYKVTSIAPKAFFKCKTLVTADLGSVKFVGKEAFSVCSNLKQVKMPSVTDIGEKAFSYCPKLASVEFGEGLTIIRASAFFRCYALTTLELPGSLKTIRNSAFSRCSIEYVSFGSSLKTVTGTAFAGITFMDGDTVLKATAANLKNSVFSGSEGTLFLQRYRSLKPFSSAGCD